MITVIIDDVSPLVNIAGMLQAHGKAYRVQRETATTLTDLRRRPSVFIGTYDISWTLRLSAPEAPRRFPCYFGSAITSIWFSLISVRTVCTRPEGHWTSTRSIFALSPKPKYSGRALCDK